MRNLHTSTVRKAGSGLRSLQVGRSAQAHSACLRPHASCTQTTSAQGPPPFDSCFPRPARRRFFLCFHLQLRSSLAFARILREYITCQCSAAAGADEPCSFFHVLLFPQTDRHPSLLCLQSIGSRCPVARCSRHGDRYQHEGLRRTAALKYIYRPPC
ncbi:hypothetical protein C8Q74DRAFT_524487 [Fomes fomentarius]|nr:hypothetical protein C8Q74DRAFT_524487 [Fomes fomentarius]